MNITFTARHFRPHPDIKEHALDTVKKLGKFFDGIVAANVILSYERAVNSVKEAEINLHVHGGVLTAKVKTDDYHKSIDKAAEKLTLQLEKYKTKLRAKDKVKVRSIKEKEA
ncbi:MAG: ribosome-associated translation inhibitor RaiA [Ignavibacteriae bacterium]|jgi:putative sigma-54 modulation protein|nr:ribosome-associated translation inhibitor RaiA [Ignavibacteriota bacterium]